MANNCHYCRMKQILFNADMASAILNGTKTVTRRVVKPQPEPFWTTLRMPYRPGDILYVPQPWKCCAIWDVIGYEVEFQDGEHVKFEFTDLKRAQKWAKYLDKPAHQWQSPYFMPREAARLFLRVMDIRAERLQDMSEADAIKEGFERTYIDSDVSVSVPALSSFSDMWDSTLKKSDIPLYGWDANPWVWVIEFERISKEEVYMDE